MDGPKRTKKFARELREELSLPEAMLWLRIREGDRVVMWYVSGNRDETAIENPYAYLIDRENPRRHLSFGFGVHRCVGNRLAELQLTIIWEEILKRFPEIRLLEEPQRSYSIFIKGYERMMVEIPRRN